LKENDNEFDIEMNDSNDPSDVIWEHLHVKKIQYYKRLVGFSILIMFFTLICFAIIFCLKNLSLTYKEKFTQIDCDEYFLSPRFEGNEYLFRSKAGREWLKIESET